VLGVEGTVRKLAPEDEEARGAAFAACLKEPRHMKLYWLVCGAALEIPLTQGLSGDVAVAHVRAMHYGRPLRTCLVLSRRRSFWSDREGQECLGETSPN
jgi:hypothetical protein